MTTPPPPNSAEIDMQLLRDFRALSPREKLRRLEELNRFLRRAMPPRSRRIAEQLKHAGF